MGNARTILISLDHMVAEMVAFPLVSGDSLERPLSSLDPNLGDETRSLWRAAERYFVAHFPHVSLDELIALRNSTWFATPNSQPVPLGKYLQEIATKWLQPLGSFAEPKLPDSPRRDRPGRRRDSLDQKESHDPAARRAWRWLTFAMPADLLLAGLAKDGKGPVRVNLLAPTLETILSDSGYAETHLHMGAGLEFPTAWAAAVNFVGRSPDLKPGMKFDAFLSPGADHAEGKRLANWLVRAAIVRYLLGAFLAYCSATGTWDAFLREDLGPLLSDVLSFTQFEQLRTAISELAAGAMSSLPAQAADRDLQRSFAAMQSTYNRLTRVSTVPPIRRLDDIQQLDPLAAFFQPQSYSGPSVQLQFLWCGSNYMEQATRDKSFANLFWQVERVRGQVYRHCIQRPLTPGLMNFVRFYERKGAISKLLELVELESSGVIGGVGHGLRSLEVRTSPARDRDSQLKTFRNWRKQLRAFRTDTSVTIPRPAQTRDGRPRATGWQAAECGLVLHFLKFRGGPSDQGAPKAFDVDGNADPSSRRNPSGYRWQGFRRDAELSANAIAAAVEAEPSMLYFLRGIDVCRDEQGVPTWVIAPLFETVRRRVNAAIARARLEMGLEFPPLRTTAHVGEDFVHLATGLRYMDEAMEYLPLRCGDRIGHGLALGVDAMVWAQKTPRLAMPREDRWFDLVWERQWHGQLGSRFTTARKTFVEDEIVRLSHEIFGTGFIWTPNLALDMLTMLFSDSSLKKVGYPKGMLPNQNSSGLLDQLERYLTEPGVYQACRTVEWVCVEDEGDAVEELQRLVRKRYADNGITIEVNPISNLLVGDLTELTTHPMWRLAPGLDQEFGPTLRICVGSDDPLPFATTLPEEYQFLYDSLILAGKSHPEARTWLDDIRRLSWESRFTVVAERDREVEAPAGPRTLGRA